MAECCVKKDATGLIDFLLIGGNESWRTKSLFTVLTPDPSATRLGKPMERGPFT